METQATKLQHGSFLLLIVLLLSIVSCASSGAVNINNDSIKLLNNLSVEYYSIASVYEEQKNYTKATEYYKKSLELSKNDKNIEYKLARVFALSEKWTEAEEIFLKLYSQDSDNTMLTSSLAYVYAQVDKKDKALLLYQKLYDKNKYDLTVLCNYGILCLDSENIEKAESLLDEMTKLDDSSELTVKLQKKINNQKNQEDKSDKKQLDNDDTTEKKVLEETELLE